MSKNNTIELTQKDLTKTIGSLYNEVMSREKRDGLPTLFYKDDFDFFKIILQGTNLGFQVCVFINHSKIHHPFFYNPSISLFEVLTKQGIEIDE
jgi:hypothetical protein